MSDTKKAGRPKKFDEREALLAAVNVFWHKGYDGASIKDLTSEMGISSPSLYATFGDKHALYLKAIEAYVSGGACAPLYAFESEENISLAVASFIKAAIQHATINESGAKGCFLGSCVATSAGEVDGVQPILKKALMDTDQRLATRFDAEVKKKMLPKGFPSLERARLLLDLRQGDVLRARAGFSGRELLKDLDARVKLVLGPGR